MSLTLRQLPIGSPLCEQSQSQLMLFYRSLRYNLASRETILKEMKKIEYLKGSAYIKTSSIREKDIRKEYTNIFYYFCCGFNYCLDQEQKDIFFENLDFLCHREPQSFFFGKRGLS